MSKFKTEPLPHSWAVADWPLHVFPNRQSAARNLVRVHRAALIECGAIERVGRTLMILGQGYALFLSRQAGRVPGYEIAPNRERPANRPPTSSGAATTGTAPP